MIEKYQHNKSFKSLFAIHLRVMIKNDNYLNK